jgi:hypothetical protein
MHVAESTLQMIKEWPWKTGMIKDMQHCTTAFWPERLLIKNNGQVMHFKSLKLAGVDGIASASLQLGMEHLVCCLFCTFGAGLARGWKQVNIMFMHANCAKAKAWSCGPIISHHFYSNHQRKWLTGILRLES